MKSENDSLDYAQDIEKLLIGRHKDIKKIA
jgi:hypothetical protein